MSLFKKTYRLLACCCMLAFYLSSHCQVRLPHLVSDGMVLQRDVPVKIWGWAAAGEKITIHFNDKIYTCDAGGNGKWTVALQPIKAGGPYNMQVDASNHITVSNILIGDLWVCSGQSNMVLPMERVKEKYPDEIAHADFPYIRQFFLPTVYNFNKQEDDVPPGKWLEATPKNVLSFSAAAYFFARELFQKYHVPIGLINSSVGGSPAEAWMSEDALKAFPGYLAIAQQCKDSLYVDSIKKADNAVTSDWNKNIAEQDKGLHDIKLWYDTAYDATGWQTMPVPGYWADNGLKGVNGVVWYRKEIEVPQEMIGKPAKLMLGRIVDMDIAYVNGVMCGTTGYQYPPRRYELAAGMLKPGKNVIVVRIVNNGGKGGFVLDKPYTLTAGGKTIDLRGEWRYKIGTSSAPLAGASTFFQYKPEGLFNSMVAPLLNYRIKGVIWYQGEANTSKAAEYAKLFSSMIADWRTQWKQGNFPFIYVQLANFMEAKDQPSESTWAELREAQRKTLSTPNTAMAVTSDIGEWNDIHPLDKEDVGKRLAFAAQKIAYGDDKIVYSGPLYRSMKTEGNKVIISFSNTGSGLITKGGGELKYFAIAGADKKFVWAKATIENNKVVVWSDSVSHPVVVRYAWADNPAGANLYNREGLPASPFTTVK